VLFGKVGLREGPHQAKTTSATQRILSRTARPATRAPRQHYRSCNPGQHPEAQPADGPGSSGALSLRPFLRLGRLGRFAFRLQAWGLHRESPISKLRPVQDDLGCLRRSQPERALRAPGRRGPVLVRRRTCAQPDSDFW